MMRERVGRLTTVPRCPWTCSFVAVMAAMVSLPALDAGRLPAETSWVLSTRVDHLMAGELGPYVEEFAALPEVHRGKALVQALTGMDPLADLQEVVLFGQGTRPEDAGMGIRARFDAARLALVVQAAEAYQRHEYRGTALHRWRDQRTGQMQSAAVVAPGWLVIARNRAVVEGCIDVAGGRRDGLPADGALAEALQDPDEDLVVVGAADGLQRLQGLGPQARLLRHVTAARMAFSAVDDTIDMQLSLRATDAAVAGHLQAMALGGRSWVLLEGREQWPAHGLAMLAAASCTVAEDWVSIATNVPQVAAIELLLEGMARKQPDLARRYRQRLQERGLLGEEAP